MNIVHLPTLIQDLAVMLGVAGIVTILFQRIHQPVVLGYLVAGIIIGPYTPPHALVNDIPNIKTLSELGVIFLMFSLGLDFTFHKLHRVGVSAMVTGLFEVIFMSLLGYSMGRLLGWSYYDCIFLGACLAISSTTIIIKAIEELHLTKKHFATLVFGILIVEDLLAIIILVILSTIVTTPNIVFLEIIKAAEKLILFVGGWFIVGYFIVPTFFRTINLYTSAETITIVSVALCLSLVCIAAFFGYSTALGAFMMGSILAETPVIKQIRQFIKPIRDIFAAVFFISIGMLIQPKIIIEQWPIILLITLITIIGKLLLTTSGLFLTGQTLPDSVRSGFSMAQVGEFSFIIVGLGLTLGVISNSLYPIIVAISAITAFSTPYLIRFSGFLAFKMDTGFASRTQYYLTIYTHGLQNLLAKSSSQLFIRKAVLQFIINGIIVAIIFTIIHKQFLPRLSEFIMLLWLAKTLSWAVALLVSSPFLWGMLYSFQPPPQQVVSLKQKIFYQLFTLFIGIMMSLEIIILSIIYFQTWSIIFLLAIMTLLFLIIAYERLEKTYRWFEKHLVKNINQKLH